jgi:hypothetical protein
MNQGAKDMNKNRLKLLTMCSFTAALLAAPAFAAKGGGAMWTDSKDPKIPKDYHVQGE